jgi:ABC-type glutathione transport system ATPase component
VLAAIRRQACSGTAIVAVFHDLNLAAALADELVLLERSRAMAAGPASEVLRDDLLTAAYGCRVLTNRTPGDGKPFVLPPAIFPASTPSGISENGTPACNVSGIEIQSNTFAFELHTKLC